MPPEEPEPHLRSTRRIWRARLARKRRGGRRFRPLRRARAFSRRARRGRRKRPAQKCSPKPPDAKDNVTGWFIYFCKGGVFLTPGLACVSNECAGGRRPGAGSLGYAGDLDAGNQGSFFTARRAAGLRELTGVEVAQGLALVEDLREEGEITDAYARYASAVYRADPQKYTPLQPGFQGPGPFERPIAPGAYGRLMPGGEGKPVGPRVSEACRCTPRPPDFKDPISGWLGYYIPTGVYLTLSPVCMPGYQRGARWKGGIWKSILGVAEPPLPDPAPLPPGVLVQPTPAPGVEAGAVPTAPGIKCCRVGFSGISYVDCTEPDALDCVTLKPVQG